MEILVDKVKYEQKIRILKEEVRIQNKQRDEQIEKVKVENEKLREEISSLKNLKEEMEQLKKTIAAQNTNGAGNVTNNTTNNYLSPDITYLDADFLTKLFTDNLIQTPIKLVPLIWLDPNHPGNNSIYVKDRKKSLAHDGNSWQIKDTSEVTKEGAQ